MELLIRLSCGGSVHRGQINEFPVKKKGGLGIRFYSSIISFSTPLRPNPDFFSYLFDSNQIKC